MAFLGDAGQTYNAPVIGGFMGNVTSTYGSWASYNTTYYKWVVPDAGTYELHANLRTRAWGSIGFTKYALLRNSDSSRNADNVRMGFEQNNNATQVNCQQHFVWIVSTTESSGDIWYLQGQAMVTNTANHSLQSDSNGYNQCWWRRLS